MRPKYDLTAGGLLGFAARAATAALALTFGLFFLFAPEQATQTVREVVQTAQRLVKQDPPKEAADEPTEEHKPQPLPKRVVRRTSASPLVRRDLNVKHSEPSQTPPDTPQPTPPSVHLRLGTERAALREMFGQPDLAIYRQEREHVLEQFVYVNRAQNDATSIVLVDGRVASVYLDNPTVMTRSATPFGSSGR